MTGKLELLCGPSGVGKTSSLEGVVRSYRWTTRDPRPDSRKEGKEYNLGDASEDRSELLGMDWKIYSLEEAKEIIQKEGMFKSRYGGTFAREDVFMANEDLAGVHKFPDENGRWYGYPISEIREGIENGDRVAEQIVPIGPIEEIVEKLSRFNISVLKRLALINPTEIELRLQERGNHEERKKIIDNSIKEYLRHLDVFDEINFVFPNKLLKSQFEFVKANNFGLENAGIDKIMAKWYTGRLDEIKFHPELYIHQCKLIGNLSDSFLKNIISEEEFQSILNNGLSPSKGKSKFFINLKMFNDVYNFILVAKGVDKRIAFNYIEELNARLEDIETVPENIVIADLTKRISDQFKAIDYIRIPPHLIKSRELNFFRFLNIMNLSQELRQFSYYRDFIKEDEKGNLQYSPIQIENYRYSSGVIDLICTPFGLSVAEYVIGGNKNYMANYEKFRQMNSPLMVSNISGIQERVQFLSNYFQSGTPITEDMEQEFLIDHLTTPRRISVFHSNLDGFIAVYSCMYPQGLEIVEKLIPLMDAFLNYKARFIEELELKYFYFALADFTENILVIQNQKFEMLPCTDSAQSFINQYLFKAVSPLEESYVKFSDNLARLKSIYLMK